MNTTTFKLPSGIECEVGEMTGLHQRLLTEQKGKKLGDNLNEMLASLLVRVGSTNGPFKVDFVQRMLSADRRTALAQARMFSVPDEEPEEGEEKGKRNFNFTWKYMDHSGNEQELPKTVDLSEGFPIKPFPSQWNEYDHIERDVLVNLEGCGKTVKFSLLDGLGELILANTKKDERSSHTAILMRNPCFMTKTSNDTVPIRMGVRDLDNLSLRDIEKLRKAIKEAEGRIDTEIRFEHPDAERLPKHEKWVIVDLLDVLAFFFPSEAI